MDDMCERHRGALVGVAVGDAAGAPFEGRARVADAEVAAWLDADAPLTWTDDTAMTIALAESLLARGGFDGPDLAARFLAAYKAEPWRGYGAGPPRVFAALAAGADWDVPARALYGGEGSFGNGGAMRAVPAGLFAAGDIGVAASLGADQARVTHAHPRGRQGAALLAAAAAVVVTGGPVDARGLVEALAEVASDPAFAQRLARLPALAGAPPAEAARVLGHGIAAEEAVPAAFQAFCAAPGDVRAVVAYAVQMGGDTDTIAAMAGGLAGARGGLRAIPQPLVARLEARERLVDLGDRLAAIAGAR